MSDTDTTTPEAEVRNPADDFPTLTPYALAKLATAIAKKRNLRDAEGKLRQMSPQTLYGQADRGTLPTFQDNDEKYWVDGHVGYQVVADFLAGKTNTRTQQRVDVDRLAAQFLFASTTTDEDTEDTENVPEITEQITSQVDNEADPSESDETETEDDEADETDAE